jgi:hypothetical protein
MSSPRVPRNAPKRQPQRSAGGRLSHLLARSKWFRGGITIATVSTCVGLLFTFCPGCRPLEPPAVRRTTINDLTIQEFNVAGGDIPAATGQTVSKSDVAALVTNGILLSYEVTIIGQRDPVLGVLYRWSKLQPKFSIDQFDVAKRTWTTINDFAFSQEIPPVEARSNEDTIRRVFWAPTPLDDGYFRLRLDISDAQKQGAASSTSPIFKCSYDQSHKNYRCAADDRGP